MRYFTFKGIRSDSFFLTNKIEAPILPPIEFETIKIAGRNGVVPFKSKLGVRTFKINVTLLGFTEAGIRDSARSIANWLYSETEQPLIFSDEPTITYYAKVSGDVNFNQLQMYGETSITFVASDPYAYGALRSFDSVGTNTQIITVNGTANTYPKITVTPTVNQYGGIFIVHEESGKTFEISGTSFEAGYGIEIDMSKNSVTRLFDSENLMPYVTLASEFFSLYKGTNHIDIGMNLNFHFEWYERFL